MQPDNALGIGAVLNPDEGVSGEQQSIQSSDRDGFGMRQVIDFAAGKIDDSDADAVVSDQETFAVTGERGSLGGEEAIGNLFEFGGFEISVKSIYPSTQAVGNVDGSIRGQRHVPEYSGRGRFQIEAPDQLASCRIHGEQRSLALILFWNVLEARKGCSGDPQDTALGIERDSSSGPLTRACFQRNFLQNAFRVRLRWCHTIDGVMLNARDDEGLG